MFIQILPALRASSTMAVVDINITLVYSFHFSLSVTDSKSSAHRPNSPSQLGVTGLIGGLTEDQWGRGSGWGSAGGFEGHKVAMTWQTVT